MEIEKKIIEDNFKCPICLNIVDIPWETSCCGHLLCEKCMKCCNSNICPVCRNNKVKFRKNVFANFLLSKLDMKCPYGCNKMIKFNCIKTHKYRCDCSIFKCQIDKCKFEGTKKESLNHLITYHSDLLAIFCENFQTMKPVFDKLEIIPQSQQGIDDEEEEPVQDNEIVIKTNNVINNEMQNQEEINK